MLIYQIQTTLCSYIEIAEKPGGVVENLGKIGDTLCVKDRNTLDFFLIMKNTGENVSLGHFPVAHLDFSG